MFLIKNWAYSCSKEHPTMCQSTVQTKCKEMAPLSSEIPKEDVDKGVKPELQGIISQT